MDESTSALELNLAACMVAAVQHLADATSCALIERVVGGSVLVNTAKASQDATCTAIVLAIREFLPPGSVEASSWGSGPGSGPGSRPFLKFDTLKRRILAEGAWSDGGRAAGRRGWRRWLPPSSPQQPQLIPEEAQNGGAEGELSGESKLGSMETTLDDEALMDAVLQDLPVDCVDFGPLVTERQQQLEGEARSAFVRHLQQLLDSYPQPVMRGAHMPFRTRLQDHLDNYPAPVINRVLVVAQRPDCVKVWQALPSLASEVAQLRRLFGQLNVDVVGATALEVGAALTDLVRPAYKALHWIGHGDQRGSLAANRKGGHFDVDAVAALLVEYNSRHSGCLQLVFLNTCWSEQQGRALHAVGCTVICHSSDIEDQLAARFSREVYDQLRHKPKWTTGEVSAATKECSTGMRVPRLFPARWPSKAKAKSEKVEQLEPDAPERATKTSPRQQTTNASPRHHAQPRIDLLADALSATMTAKQLRQATTKADLATTPDTSTPKQRLVHSCLRTFDRKLGSEETLASAGSRLKLNATAVRALCVPACALQWEEFHAINK